MALINCPKCGQSYSDNSKNKYAYYINTNFLLANIAAMGTFFCLPVRANHLRAQVRRVAVLQRVLPRRAALLSQNQLARRAAAITTELRIINQLRTSQMISTKMTTKMKTRHMMQQ